MRCTFLILLVVMMYSNFENNIEAAYADGRNTNTLERLICKSPPGSKLKNFQCWAKNIDRHDNIKFLVSANLTDPVRELWVRLRMYYKYSTYFKIADLWTDICKYFDGSEKSYIMDYLRPLAVKYTNMYHACPFFGKVLMKADNVSIHTFVLPQIVPAGRYRIDLNITEGYRGTPLVDASIYGAISDHRVEVV